MGNNILDGFLNICVCMSPDEVNAEDLREVEYTLKSKLKQLERFAMAEIIRARENRKIPIMRLVK